LGSLTLLVIADTHYIHNTEDAEQPAKLAGRYTLEWTRRAMEEACRVASPDAIVLLGDIVHRGLAPGAWQDMTEFAAVVREPGAPVVCAPGNHDAFPAKLLNVFGDAIGPHRVGDYVLYSFADDYAADDSCARRAESIRRFEDEVRGGAPVIALQHNPIYPEVDSSGYPYMPTNAAEIVASYERAGALLSLSGHYHDGQDLCARNGVNYLTCKSLAEAPYSFCLVNVRGRDVAVRDLSLQMPDEPALVDGHTHTQFGYCAKDVHPVLSERRARLLGLKGLACVEHVGQVYLPNEMYGRRVHIEDPDAIRKARDAGTDRMDAFKAFMGDIRSDYVRIGMEVEVDRTGKLNLLDEDRDGWDVVLGAVHWLPSTMPSDTPKECARSFQAVVEQLVAEGIDVLAHPFRLFRGGGMPRPVDLYRPIAKLLAASDVAAEINCHNNEPDPEFFRTCVEEGVRLAVGSDAHRLREVGDLAPHLRLLEAIGAAPRDREPIAAAREG